MQLSELKKAKITERIDNVTLVHDRYRGEILPAPISLKIELTSACNWSCQFCIKSLRPDNKIMDRDLFLKITREAREFGVNELGVFFIGESFVAKDMLPWAIKQAKDMGYFVFLTTNGAAATEARMRECMEAGLDSLKFSVNFYDDEQFAKIAQVDPKQRRRGLEMLKTARRIIDEGGYDCQLSASSIKFDGEQAAKMQVVLDEINPYLDEPAYFLPLYGMSYATQTNLVHWKPKPGNPGRADMLRPSLPCHSVSTESFVCVDGRMTACCFGTGVEDGSLIMADLKEVSFAEGWNNVAFQELRRAHLAGDVRGTGCEHCIAGG